jgi:hypothetical protein
LAFVRGLAEDDLRKGEGETLNMWLLDGVGYRAVFAVVILLGSLLGTMSGEVKQPDSTDDLYAGIEVSNEGLTVVALRAAQNEEEAGLKLAYSDVIRLALWRRSDGSFSPQASFTPQQLIAGAEMLKAVAEELKWQEKKIVFARFGHFGGILSYIRLQVGDREKRGGSDISFVSNKAFLCDSVA